MAMHPLDDAAPITVRNILVATDFSAVSEVALLYALGIARRTRAKVYVANVVADAYGISSDSQQRALNDAWRDAHAMMTDHFIAGRLDGIEHQLLVEPGEVWTKLSEMISKYEIDFLVTGTRGRSRIAKLLLGSTAETIFRQAPCPVLTVGPRAKRKVPPEGPKKILFCTGFSAHSLNAGRHALWLAEQQSALLILLHVSKEETISGAQRREVAMLGEHRLRALIPSTARLAQEPKFLVEFGTAANRILAVAHREKPDLIVLGVRQPEGFARRLKWATAYELVTHAPCPVLTVRRHEG